MWPGLAHSIGIQGSKYEGSIVQERCSITFYDILSETTHHHFWLFLLVSTVYTYIHIYYTYIYTYAIYIVYTYIFINKWEEKNTDNYKYSHSFKNSQDLFGIHNIHFPLPIPCPFYHLSTSPCQCSLFKGGGAVTKMFILDSSGLLLVIQFGYF